MRYELKHDKLAPQIFLRASAAAKARRRAKEIYVLYSEIAELRLLTAEELEYLGSFASVMPPPNDLQKVISLSRDKLRDEADSKRRRALYWAAAGFLVAVMAILTSIWAFYKNQQAQNALEEIVNRDLKEADQLILYLDYEAAWKKLLLPPRLKTTKLKIAQHMLEPAFWNIETGRLKKAKTMLDTIAQVSGSREISKLLRELYGKDSLQQLRYLRRCVIALDDSLSYKNLRARYYPEMILVKGGTFMMGSDPNVDRLHQKDETPHSVTLDDFEMAATETTVWQWSVYEGAIKGISGKDIQLFYDSPGVSPVKTNWYDAVEYANWLSETQGLSDFYGINKSQKDPNNKLPDQGLFLYDPLKWLISTPNWRARGYRLPTEAEWEYAARGGPRQTPDIFSGNQVLDSVGWFKKNATGLQSVARKNPNALGIYDMSGNLREWCWDWYGEDYYQKCFQRGVVINPKGPEYGYERVIRGGSFYDESDSLRVANRDAFRPNAGDFRIGFRLSRSH